MNTLSVGWMAGGGLSLSLSLSLSLPSPLSIQKIAFPVLAGCSSFSVLTVIEQCGAVKFEFNLNGVKINVFSSNSC